MDASKSSKDSLRAAGKKRLEEFRLKRQQKAEGAPKIVETQEDLTDSSIKDGNASAQGEILDKGQHAPERLDPQAEEPASTSGSDLLEQVKSLQTENRLVSAQLEACQAELRLSKERVEQLSEQVSTIKAEKDAELAAILAQKNEAVSKVKNLEAQLEALQLEGTEMCTQLEAEKNDLASSFQTCQEQLRRMEEENEKVIAEIELRINQIQKNEPLAHFQNLEIPDRLASAISTIEHVVQTNAQEKATTLAKVEVLSRQMEELEREKSKLSSEILALSSENDNLKEQIQEVVAQKKTLAVEVARLQQQNVDLAGQSTVLAQELKDFDATSRAEMDVVKAENQRLTQQLQDTREHEQAIISELDRVRACLLEQEGELERRETEFRLCKDRCNDIEKQIEVIRGENAQDKANLLTEIERLTHELKEVQVEKDRVVAELAAVKRENDHLKEQKTVLAEDRDLNVRLRDEQIDKLQKENSDLFSKLNDLSEKLKDLDAASREVDMLKADGERLTQQLEETKANLLTEIERLTHEVKEVQVEKDRVVAELTAVNCENEHLKEQKKILGEDSERLRDEQIDKLQKEKSDLLSELNDLSQKLKELDAASRHEVDMLKADGERLTQQLEETKANLSAEIERLTQEKDRVVVELTAVNCENEHLKEQKKSLVEDSDLNARLRDEQIDKLQKENSDLLSELNDVSQKLKELDAASRLKVDMLTSDGEHLSQQLEETKERERNIMLELTSVRGRLQHVLEQVDDLNGVNSKLQSQLRSQETEINLLRDQSTNIEKQIKLLTDENLGLSSLCKDYEQREKRYLDNLERHLANSQQEGQNKVYREGDIESALERLKYLEENSSTYVDALDRLESGLVTHQNKVLDTLGELAALTDSMLQGEEHEASRMLGSIERLEKQLTRLDSETRKITSLIAETVADSTISIDDSLEANVSTALSTLTGRIKESDEQLRHLGARLSELETTLATVNDERQMENERAASTISEQELKIKEMLEREQRFKEEVVNEASQRDQLQLRVEQGEKVLLNAEKDRMDALSEIKDLKQERDTMKQRLIDLQEAIVTHERDALDWGTRIRGLETVVKDKDACIRKAEEIICGLETDFGIQALALPEKVEFLAAKLLQLRENEEATRRELDESHRKALEELHITMELLHTELSTEKRSKGDLSQKLEMLAAEHTRMEETFNQQRAVLEARLEEYQAVLQAMWIKVSKFLSDEMLEDNPDLAAETDILHRLESSIDVLISRCLTNAHRISDIEKNRMQLEDKVQELIKEKEKIKNDLDSVTADGSTFRSQVAAVTAERDRLQLELSESEQRVVALREKLGLAIKKGKGLAQQRDELKQALTDADNLRSSLAKNQEALELAMKDQGSEIETLRKTLSEKEASFGAEIQSLKLVGMKVQEELHESSTREKTLATELATLKRKLADICDEKQLLEESKREAWLELQRAGEEIASLHDELRYKSKELQSLLHELHERNEEFDELSTRAKELEKEVGSVRTSEEKKGLQLQKLGKENKSLREELRTKSEELQALLHEIGGKDEQIGRLSTRGKRLDEEMESLRADRSSKIEEVVSSSAELREKNKQFDRLSARAGIFEQELESLRTETSSKTAELDSLSRELQEKNKEFDRLSRRVEELEDLIEDNHETMGSMETSRTKAVGKLTFTLGKLNELQQQCEAMLAAIESLQTSLDKSNMEISGLNEKIEILQKDLDAKDATLLQLETKLKSTAANIGGQTEEGTTVEPLLIVEMLDTRIQQLQHENQKLELSLQRKDAETQNLQKKVDAMNFRLERGKGPVPERITSTEIIELEQPKHMLIASAPHIRSQKKTFQGDQVAIDMDSFAPGSEEEKGTAFKSLGMLRFLPKASHPIGNRIDSLCVMVGSVLMRQPVARLTLVVYWIAIHVWIATSVSMAKI